MRLRTLLACLALLAAFTAPMGVAAGQVAEQKPLRVAINGFENNLTPFSATFGAFPNTHDLISLVYDSLFWSQVREDPEPWLAERAEPNADLTEWTVTLRDGVTWHDGKPLTAEDVKFSFEYYQEQAGASGRYAHHVFDVPPLRAASVVDPRTIRLSYEAPAPAFRIMPGADLPILPKHVWEGVTDPRTASTGPPVGSGPYKLVQIVPDQLYRFEANPAYFKGRPTVDVLELPIVRDPSAAFAALRTGEVGSVASAVPPELVDQFSRNADIRIAKSTKFESTQIFFNARKAPLDDARLRKAIAMGVDRKALVDTVLLGHGRPGLPTFLHPDSPWAVAEERPDHNPAAARTLLDQAGYTPGPDGVRRAPGGNPLEFTLLVSSFAPPDIRAGQLISQQLAPLGVRLRVEALDPATLRQRRQVEPGKVPGYDAYVSTLEAHTHVDPDGLYYFFHSPGNKGFGAGISGYTNRRFDALAESAATAAPEERRRLLRDMQELLAAEAPAVVLWYRDGDWAYRPSAYDGWVEDSGQGIFTKRSFLAQYADQARGTRPAGAAAPASAERNTQDGGVGSPLLWVAAVAAAALAAVVLARRRTTADEDD
ncbi:MAG: ABC transporter substrate-binding protein [Actinomycetota bacterium]|nr:ABC transporter substrate-binding protein [Actinomycetota bacterium]